MNDKKLYKKLILSNSFEDFFTTVCEEKVRRDRTALIKLSNIIRDDLFINRYGELPITYLDDCISTEKVLPCKMSEPRNNKEAEMKKLIIKNFASWCPEFKLIGEEKPVEGIGRIDILAKHNDTYVIFELKSGSYNPNTQLLAYASKYDNPFLIGVTEKPISHKLRLKNITYYLFDERVGLIHYE